MRRVLITLFVFLMVGQIRAAHQPEFSTAGFFKLDGTGREVYNMNAAWRFYKGAAPQASQTDFDDRSWSVVSLPHGIEYLPTEASGCVNYQGEVWYRKHFSLPDSLAGKKLFLHFEAIMGKSKVWINGHLLNEYFGGFLPVIGEITPFINREGENLIAVCADNSDDPSYPPGKFQNVLDFTYAGGIYRDCWLIAHNDLFITDPNYEQQVAGGGLFVAYDAVSEASADVLLNVQLRNARRQNFSGKVLYELYDKTGKRVSTLSRPFTIGADTTVIVSGKMVLKHPLLWSPETPDLYQLHVLVQDRRGKTVDGYRRRIGVRSFEFKGQDGFWLNGKPYEQPIIGANRHQDFAVVGNALANSIHWRDAKKLRDVGLKMIRNAHYPQDPAFMDACDELGLLVIVNTPGWQFWNAEPVFEQRVYSDIRNIVRRDRNHPSVWMWEPILNETWYPENFAKNTLDLVHEEYPYPSCYAASDETARGSGHFQILFTHPATGDSAWAAKSLDPKKSYFTREWGDNVDDWNSQNSPSRVSRAWGEAPMLVQADHYANPLYQYSTYDAFFRTTRQHFGGCLWHSFDHQRGYHPDPFYGGLMDVFRQPKYSYFMFKAQRDPVKSDLIAETGPMVKIAHEMTPFSPEEVTVFSNCDEVRLTYFKGGKQYSYQKDKTKKGMPSPIIRFAGVYHFMDDKEMSRTGKQRDVFMLAEGLMGGQVVATDTVFPARRPSKLVLWLDDDGVELKADGSDFVTVVAGIADRNGRIKRLNNYQVAFSVEGEGRILGDERVLANPRPVVWGTAPVLLQSTVRPGRIRVTARVLFEGSQMPVSGELVIDSKPAAQPLVFSENELGADVRLSPAVLPVAGKDLNQEVERLTNELNQLKLKEVERQQKEFGEQ